MPPNHGRLMKYNAEHRTKEQDARSQEDPWRRVLHPLSFPLQTMRKKQEERKRSDIH